MHINSVRLKMYTFSACQDWVPREAGTELAMCVEEGYCKVLVGDTPVGVKRGKQSWVGGAELLCSPNTSLSVGHAEL